MGTRCRYGFGQAMKFSIGNGFGYEHKMLILLGYRLGIGV